MNDLDFLLTEEYQEFAANVRQVFEEKKTVDEEFKKVYAAYKKTKSELEEKAEKLHDAWEKWKSEQTGKT
jgi:Skp family chaperone for outer membrane proteins